MRHEIPLSAESWSVLQKLAKGSTLVARRVFPHPHSFHISKPPGSRAVGEYAKPVAAITIDQLLGLSLVSAEKVRGGTDHLRYSLTPKGSDVVVAGELVEEDGQIDWTEAIAS
jgi:hypothetical protein